MKRALILFAVLIVAAAGWTVYWFVTADTVRRELAQQLTELERDGLDIDGEYDITGFPFRYIVEISDLRLHQANGVAWQTPALQIYAQPWNLSHAIVVFDSAHQLAWPTGDGGATGISVILDSARASLIWDAGGLSRAALDVRDIEALSATSERWGSAARLQLHYDKDEHALRLSGDDLRLPGQPEQGPDLPVEAVIFETAPSGDWSSTTLRQVKIEWGTLALNGDGVLFMGPTGGIDGHIDARMEGLSDFLLAGKEALPPEQAVIADLIAALETDLGPDQQRREMIIDDGVVYYASIPVIDVAELIRF